MSIIINLLRKLNLYKRGSHRYLWPGISLVLLIIIGALVIVFYEKGVNEQFESFGDGIWWAIVTITTVGYGDKSPVTLSGRIVALIVMLGGIGTFGYIAGALLEDFLNKGRGLKPVNYKNHYVICDYSFKAKSIVEELLAHEEFCQIVLVADREDNPLQGQVAFVKGDTSDENILKKANVGEAKTVIVLADGNLEEKLADAQSVLSTLTVRHLNPEVKIIAEVLDHTNHQHFMRAGADDIISSGEILSSLIVRASLYGSGSKAIKELITNSFGNEIYDMKVREEWIGKHYEDVFNIMHEKKCLLIGFARGDKIMTNPEGAEILQRDDNLIYIASKGI